MNNTEQRNTTPDQQNIDQRKTKRSRRQSPPEPTTNENQDTTTCTSAILEPQCMRNGQKPSTALKGKVKSVLGLVEGVTYQGVGPTGVVVAITGENQDAIRSKLQDVGVIISDDKYGCEHPWLGIPEGRTLFEVQEVKIQPQQPQIFCW